MKANQRWQLFEQFSQMAIKHPDSDICKLYNIFANSVEEDDLPFIADNFAQFIRTAENARKAPDEIKKLILAE